MTRPIATLVIAAVVVACSSGPDDSSGFEGGENETAGESDGGDEGAASFRDAVPTFEGDVEVFDNPAELADAVELVVMASTQDVRSGREITFNPDQFPENVTETLVFEMTVDEHLSGAPSDLDVVYVEVQISDKVDPQRVGELAPEDAVLFLSEAADFEEEETTVDKANAGVPEGSTLYGAWPAGFLFEESGEVVDLRVELDELGAEWDMSSLGEVEEAASDPESS